MHIKNSRTCNVVLGSVQDHGKRHMRSKVACQALFDGVTSGLQKAWDIVKIDGKLNEDNIKGPMREIRRALLEADVSLPVVRGFVKRVETRALGVKVRSSPGHLS